MYLEFAKCPFTRFPTVLQVFPFRWRKIILLHFTNALRTCCIRNLIATRSNLNHFLSVVLTGGKWKPTPCLVLLRFELMRMQFKNLKFIISLYPFLNKPLRRYFGKDEFKQRSPVGCKKHCWQIALKNWNGTRNGILRFLYNRMKLMPF